jgi:hypothetical protein
MLSRKDVETILAALEGMSTALSLDLQNVRSDLAITSIAIERGYVQDLFVKVTSQLNWDAVNTFTGPETPIYTPVSGEH